LSVPTIDKIEFVLDLAATFAIWFVGSAVVGWLLLLIVLGLVSP
jgi:hypothetical protein